LNCFCKLFCAFIILSICFYVFSSFPKLYFLSWCRIVGFCSVWFTPGLAKETAQSENSIPWQKTQFWKTWKRMQNCTSIRKIIFEEIPNIFLLFYRANINAGHNYNCSRDDESEMLIILPLGSVTTARKNMICWELSTYCAGRKRISKLCISFTKYPSLW